MLKPVLRLNMAEREKYEYLSNSNSCTFTCAFDMFCAFEKEKHPESTGYKDKQWEMVFKDA